MTSINPIDARVGGKIRLRRIQLGMQLASLAAKLNISETRLQRFEAGRERIDARLLQTACEALKARPKYFFEKPIAVEQLEKAAFSDEI